MEENEDGTYLVCIQCGYTEKIVDEELATLLSAIQTKDNKKKDMSEV